MVKPSIEVDISHVPDLANVYPWLKLGLGISHHERHRNPVYQGKRYGMFALKTELAKVGVEIHYSARISSNRKGNFP